MEHTNTNQVMSEFSLKMSTDQFYDINHIYIKLYIGLRCNFTRDTRYIEIYYGRFSGQMEFRNILFQRIKVTR
jgi:hypothetical protein